MDDLNKLSRDELNTYAGELGMADAAEYPNKAELIAAIEAATTPDAEADATDDEPKTGVEPAKAGQRYQVLKAVTDEEGRTYMPGEEFTPGSGFPSRRPKQLVEQKFLRPLD